MRERRRFHRFNLQGRVQLQLGGKRYEFPTADISVNGIGVMLDVAVLGAKPAGEVGTCIIESPDLAAPVEAYVSVMRIRRIGHQHLVGLRLSRSAMSNYALFTLMKRWLRREKRSRANKLV